MIFTGLIALFTGLVRAHMAMIDPCTNFTPNGLNCPALPAGASYDYNLKSPIGTKDAIIYPLCKNPRRRPTPVAVWNAGDTVTVAFESGGAAHGGGHCQFSLSYDNGNNFVVVHEELRHCFFNGPSNTNDAVVLKYDFVLPSSVPASDNVIFAWSWVNAIGNREFYMNCADIKINSHSSSYSGKRMVIANYGPSNPVVTEFNGDYTTGLYLYKNSPIITVYGNGATLINGSSPYYSQVKPVGIVESSLKTTPVKVGYPNTGAVSKNKPYTKFYTRPYAESGTQSYSKHRSLLNNLPYFSSYEQLNAQKYAKNYSFNSANTQRPSYSYNKQGELQISRDKASTDATASTPSVKYTGFISTGNVAESSVNIDLGNGYESQSQAVARPGVYRSPDNPSGVCISGNMMCSPSGNSYFFVCNHNSWTKFSLSDGIICKSNGAGVSFSSA
ncbi:hypothetical protein AYI68_g1359 [Smittium mucronatum]|uniref:Chitin-binding type-4 domain-containing protein n=1 Tax=Smittium mucronatum TaxID=133383 RepID=A0A1R0H5W8_9FUNG|nr:hypothetical protein AYI68_g1359 [Smittium mucronatum]